MEVKLYNFSKRNRETLRVTGNGTTVQCTLKEGTSITDPVLLFQTQVASTYNYVYIPYFGRYYFVAGSKAVENMWEISCTEDYLATFKPEIGLTQCNILYATGSTKNIPDSRIPVTAHLRTAYEQRSLGFSLNYATTRYILGITGKGSFGCYILENESKLAEMLDGIDSWSSFITDNWTFTKQLFFGGSASECLRSALGIPIAFNKADHGDLEELSLGNYPCMDSNGNPIKGYKITDPILDYGTSITIPWIYSDWRNLSAYTDVCLYIPLIGLISLPASELINETNLTISYKINITSGDIAIEIFGESTRKKYATCSGNCAMPIGFGSTGIDTNKVTQAAVTGIGTLVAINAATGAGGSIAAMAAGVEGGALMGNAAIGAGLASTAFQALQALGGNASGSAGLGGGAACALDDKVYCFVVSKELTDTQAHLNPIIGKPYMAVGTPSQFSGYVQTDGFQLASSKAYSSEKDMVNKLMDSGIYYT